MTTSNGGTATADREIVLSRVIGALERIALLHGESRDDPNAFEQFLTFSPSGEQTRIVLHTVFPTKELRDEAVEKYHAIEGGEQTLRHLAAYVAELISNDTPNGAQS